MTQIHARHRAAALAVLEERSLAGVFPTGSEKTRNADSTYRFRPDSDFYYLTGFAEPEAVLVLAPHGDEARSVLFLREKDRAQEVWTGIRLGVEAAPEALGVDAAHPIEELPARLPELLQGHQGVVYQPGIEEARDRVLVAAVEKARQAAKRGKLAPEEWVYPTEIVHELRLRKSPWELDLMRRAARITDEAHRAAMGAAAPGANEAELDALLEYTFRRRGSTGPAYTNIVAGGPGACILHYVENDKPLRDGDLVLIDAGAEWSYYASDVTRTFPVNGTFGAEQRALYEVVLGAQKRAVEAVRPGAPFPSVHETAVRHLCEGLVELGLLKGPVEEAVEEETYRRLYMHRTSHWLGLDVHDCGSYFVDGQPRALEPGMVLTVEPGIYVAPDDEEVDARWRGTGIRIEDDVLVTEEGHEVLSAAVPKEVEEVEACCRDGGASG